LKGEFKRNFLIIDFRPEEKYNEFHIKEAVNIPFYHFNQDRIPRELYYYKNKEDRSIIVYDEDIERGQESAKTLVRKGYKNLLLLSGGILRFTAKYRELVDGLDVPFVELPDTSKTRFKTRYKQFKKSPKKPVKVKKTKLPRKDLLRS